MSSIENTANDLDLYKIQQKINNLQGLTPEEGKYIEFICGNLTISSYVECNKMWGSILTLSHQLLNETNVDKIKDIKDKLMFYKTCGITDMINKYILEYMKIMSNKKKSNKEISNKKKSNKEISNKEISNKEISNKEISNKEISNKE